MKKLLILSGKGGTGKTTLAGAFIRLSSARRYADCDVDAPNLHLVLSQEMEPVIQDFYGLDKAWIDPDLCTNCGLCRENCRFDAIHPDPIHQVDPYGCEGCAVCQLICPASAVSMMPAAAGLLMRYDNHHLFSTARLNMGSGNSGKLVTEVKKQLGNDLDDTELAIIDGSPGIGCPVIASISGVDLVLVVAEPTVSGISDMERILETAKIFRVPTTVCVNKYDVNQANTEKIEGYCRSRQIPYLGRIPYDPKAVMATNQGKTIVDLPCLSGQEAERIFYKLLKLIFQGKAG